MKRQSLLALVLPLVFATPSVAQTTADMSRPIYGPSQEAPTVASPQPEFRLHLVTDTIAPVAVDYGPRYFTRSELGPHAALGLGSFKTKRLTQPFSTQRRDPASPRIAAVGVAVKF
jgi:hypothetical protein